MSIEITGQRRESAALRLAWPCDLGSVDGSVRRKNVAVIETWRDF